MHPAAGISYRALALLGLLGAASCAGDPLVGDYAGNVALADLRTAAIPEGAAMVSIRATGPDTYALRWVNAQGDCTLSATRDPSGVRLDGSQPLACLAGASFALVDSGSIALDRDGGLVVGLVVAVLYGPLAGGSGEIHMLTFGGTRR